LTISEFNNAKLFFLLDEFLDNKEKSLLFRKIVLITSKFMNSRLRSQLYINHDDIILFGGKVNEFFEKSSLLSLKGFYQLNR
jgi:hypothetical protein